MEYSGCIDENMYPEFLMHATLERRRTRFAGASDAGGGAKGLPLVPWVPSFYDLCPWNFPLQRLEASIHDNEPADDAEEPPAAADMHTKYLVFDVMASTSLACSQPHR